MKRLLAAAVTTAALSAALAAPAAAHNDPCSGPWQIDNNASLALVYDANGDGAYCFKPAGNGPHFKDNHRH